MRSGLAGALLLLTCAACSHLEATARYRSRAEVLVMSDCGVFDGLRDIESKLFKNGFVRKPADAAPRPYELNASYVLHTPRVVTFVKSDFVKNEEHASEPYREIKNEYKLAVCDQIGGQVSLIVVRHDPVSTDKFIGARFDDALKASQCTWKSLAPPREIGFYQQSTEDDLLWHVRRGKCREFALGDSKPTP